MCPEQAIIAGDLDDPAARIAQMVATKKLSQRAVEQGTKPNLWYKGAASAALDPLAARTVHQSGSIWRDTSVGQAYEVSFLDVDLTPGAGLGGPAVAATRGDRRVSSTTRITPCHGDGRSRPTSSQRGSRPVWRWSWRSPWRLGVACRAHGQAGECPSWRACSSPSPGGILVWDLKRPDRFYFLLTKGNPGSWLVRGAWILGASALAYGVWFLVGVLGGGESLLRALARTAAAIGVAVAGYTAFLFGQAEGRDPRQSPLLLWHMIAGSLTAGGAFTVLVDQFLALDASLETAAVVALTIGLVVLGLLSAGELLRGHPTRNVAEAVRRMTKGASARQWWGGSVVLGIVVPLSLLVLDSLAVTFPGLPALAGIYAISGIWFADDAMVRAGQAVPLS